VPDSRIEARYPLRHRSEVYVHLVATIFDILRFLALFPLAWAAAWLYRKGCIYYAVHVLKQPASVGETIARTSGLCLLAEPRDKTEEQTVLSDPGTGR